MSAGQDQGGQSACSWMSYTLNESTQELMHPSGLSCWAKRSKLPRSAQRRPRPRTKRCVLRLRLRCSSATGGPIELSTRRIARCSCKYTTVQLTCTAQPDPARAGPRSRFSPAQALPSREPERRARGQGQRAQVVDGRRGCAPHSRRELDA